MNPRIPLSLFVALLMMVLGSTAHAESQPFGTVGQMSPYGQFSLRYGQDNRNLGGYSTAASSSKVAAGGGIDYFQRDNFSIGGFFQLQLDLEDYETPQVSTLAASAALGPRLGWNVPLSAGVSLYSRIGTSVGFYYFDGGSYETGSSQGPLWPSYSAFIWSGQLSVDLRVKLKDALYLDIGPTVRQELVGWRSSSPETTPAPEHVREYDFFFTVGLAWVLEK